MAAFTACMELPAAAFAVGLGGILLWLVTFVAATPVGLSLARNAHLSLTRLSEEATPPPAPSHAA